ncbi:serine hydrolase [Mucilaginibacter sp. UR6-11]|uniref:serine hydrolase domain-containing protein n=1 Tax=Mucilaginibacter sp. UR6-11 TaxID=1435644 RepID=UPI001E43B6A2|nr:serine hydrolase [Mucilaginibacter sp. UR6-11]MCC8424776.1 serine hydrolase [Mucilaginibacter sp. UR6-11]
MSENKPNCLLIILLAFTLFNYACAQNAGQAYLKEQKLVEQSTVLLNNDNYLIPLKNIGNLKIASIHLSNPYASGFDSLLNKYARVRSVSIAAYAGKPISNLTADLKSYNTIIVQANEADLNNAQLVKFITDNQHVRNVVVAYFGRGQALDKLNEVTAPILYAERTTAVAAGFSAQAIFGGIALTRKLTGTVTQRYRFGMGFLTEKTRLEYSVPEAAGINSGNLQDIDKIAKEAMLAHATPGCVVLVAKDGKVIFNKAYGYRTYSADVADQITDIFDVASMTKISATTIAAMQLKDEGKLNVDSTLSYYLPITRNTNKSDIQLRELLLHQAGLIPDIPTFEKITPADHSTDSSALYPVKVNNGYYLRKDYFKDIMFPAILNSPLRTRGQYVYSDLSMILMQQVIEAVTNTPINQYVQQQFYNRLNMQTAGFLPLSRFSPGQIVPSEDDEVYRHAELVGYVNDPTAALMGGVAGHAGLFASANDIAILYQMLLNKGSYGGDQYFKPETVDLFTSKQTRISRRGLGFDRWDPITDHHYPSELASPDSYGHTGYTGTCVWVDPKYNLVYVFLSNRTYPKVSSKLGSLNIRPRIQDVIYKAIAKGL